MINYTLEAEEADDDNGIKTFSFKAWIKNFSNTISNDYKLNATFFNLPQQTSCKYLPHKGQLLFMYICNYCCRLSSLSKESLFPNELIETGHYQFTVPIESTCDILIKYI